MLEALQARQFVAFDQTDAGIRLVEPQRALTGFHVDWQQLDRRRRGDTAKLDAMQRYAYHVGCRRQFVLRYFGDAAAGTVATQCAGCDNCLGVKHEISTPTSAALPRSRRASLPKPERAARAATAREEAREIALSADDEDVFSALRTLRSELARAEQVPAYVVFPDRTLAEFALRRPRTLAAMSGIRGVGPAKLEKYGERFLAAIRNGAATDAA